VAHHKVVCSATTLSTLALSITLKTRTKLSILTIRITVLNTGRTDRCSTDEQTDEEMDKQALIEKWADRQNDGKMDRQTDLWINGQMDRLMYKIQTNRLFDKWTDKQTVG